MSARRVEHIGAVRRRQWGLALSLFCLVALMGVSPLRGQESVQVEFYALINAARLEQGLAPLGSSKLLMQAAQRHAEDIAGMGTATHQGSDGSDYRQRIREARYDAWEDGLKVNELFWMGLGTATDAASWLRNNPESWQILSSPDYREIGIGYAEDEGVRIFVVNVGSRPGVLPVFLNDGAELTDSPQVAVRLTNEEAVPLGEGTWMGKAIEVRLSSSPEFDDIPWQPWEPLLPWLLEGTEPGEYAVYVEYRDGAGRTSAVGDTIRLVAPGETLISTPSHGLATPVPQDSEATPGASATETLSPAMPTPAQEPGPAAEATPTSQIAPGGAPVLTPYPTWTPLPADALPTVEPTRVDWPVVLAIGLQAIVLILGLAVFLRRR